MPYDHKNFAYSIVATVPSPPSSGTTLVLASGGGALMPAFPFPATVWPSGQQPLASNAEVVLVTNRSGDTITMTRAQEGSSARAIQVGDQFAATITALQQDQADVLVVDPAGFSALTAFDQMMADIVVDATLGVIWRMRYRAASGSAYKWEWVGGSDLYSIVDTTENMVNGAYGDCATVGPSVTLPKEGDYLLRIQDEMFFNGGFAGVGNGFTSYQIGATTATDAEGYFWENINGSGDGDGSTVGAREFLKTAVPASTAVTMKYKYTGAQASAARHRILKARPIRIKQ